MNRRIMLYLCDPNKNCICDKRYCVYNHKAIIRVCDGTSRKEYARLDAYDQPIVLFDSDTMTEKKYLCEKEAAI